LGKPSAPLEIMTLAFAGCAFFIYLLLLDHPQGVETPIYIKAQRSPSVKEIAAMACICLTYFWFLRTLPLDIQNSYHHVELLKHGREPQPSLSSLVPAEAPCSSAAFTSLPGTFIFPIPSSVYCRESSLITALTPGVVGCSDL
jgi:hypothetical protein